MAVGVKLVFMCLCTATMLHALNMMSTHGSLRVTTDRDSDRGVQATLILALIFYAIATLVSAIGMFGKPDDRINGLSHLVTILALFGALFTLVALSIFQHEYLKVLDRANADVLDVGLSPVPYATALYSFDMILGLLASILNCCMHLSSQRSAGDNNAPGAPAIVLSSTPGGYVPRTTEHAPGQAGYAPQQAGYAPQQAGYAPGQAGYAPGQTWYAPGQAGYVNDGATATDDELQVHYPPGFQQPSPGMHRKGDGATGLAEPAPKYIPKYS